MSSLPRGVHDSGHGDFDSAAPRRPALHALGLVYAQGILGALGGGKTQKMVQALYAQAQQLGADAIIDVKTVIGGDSAHCVMTGTAIKLR